MLTLLSPAKTLDFDRPVPDTPPRRPGFVAESSELIALLRDKSAAEISALMYLSPALTELNVARYAAWRPRFTPRNSRPAVLAFNGDVYEGLDAPSLSTDDLAWADEHIAILSGLYGVLRPLDAMQAYRLEMGTALPNTQGGTLYAYWGDRIAQHLNKRLRGAGPAVIVNLASQEYFRAADRPCLKARVLECVFEDWKNGQYKVISFFAKRARGLMARFVVEQRIEQPEELKAFSAAGYAFEAQASSTDRWVFRRRLTEE
jgi:cytoplasmic iron level regulating protein YaaA (DUF328/UPF0246 family)